jgi:hypothetical protein
MLGQGPNYAVHLAHSLPFDEGGVYTVLSDTADGPSFNVQHASALAAITRKSLEGLVPTSGSTSGSEEEWEEWPGEGLAKEAVQQGGGKSRLDQRLNKVLNLDVSPKPKMLGGDPWRTEPLLNAGGDDCKSQSLPRWFWGWLDNHEEPWVPDKWAPKKAPDSDRVKAVLVTPEYDGDCMIRCFFMGAFESFPHRIGDLVRLLTTTPCRVPNHTKLAKSHAWCVSAVAEGGGADRISLPSH